MASTFKDALSSLADTAADLTTLEVYTYTGDVSSALDKDQKGIDWDNLFEKSKITNGTLKLVAATRVSFDGDTQNFQTAEPLERIGELLQVHEQSVNNSRLARQSLVQFFTDGMKSLVGSKK
jgi:hypothetical protein